MLSVNSATIQVQPVNNEMSVDVCMHVGTSYSVY